MIAKTFIATTGTGLARAECDRSDTWSVEFLLTDQEVRCLAADPHNPDVLYAGSQGNGVLRSDDRGQSWRSVGLDGQIVKALAISPHRPDTVYAGTKPAYVHVSNDGGQTWTELESFRRIRGRRFWFSPAEKPGTAYVQAIALSPTDPEVLLAGIEFGAVLRSADGGRTWSGHRRGALRDCHNLKFHAVKGDWVYEAGGTGGGASVSRDGGQTWRKVKSGLAKHYGVACAADPERPDIWYVSVAPSPGKAFGEKIEAYLYRATGDAGWQPIGWAPHPLRQMPVALVTDPTAPGQLYAGVTNGDVWHTADYGDTWQKLPFNLKGIWMSLVILG